MNTILKLALLSIIFSFSSCKKEEEKPKVIYENASKEKALAKANNSQIKIADLPINMEGTNYLIFPIGDLNIYTKNAKAAYGSSYSDSDVSFTISNYSEYQITGYLQNLKFQEIGRDTITSLTDKPVLIQTATYLKDLSDKTKQQYMIYTLADMDTNRDGKLDANDIKTLYLSEISGKNFLKLSPDFQELIDWNLIIQKNQLFFRTIEDINKNGEFDKNDVVHYHYVDLASKELKVHNYQPVQP
jgi:hypothetical protein